MSQALEIARQVGMGAVLAVFSTGCAVTAWLGNGTPNLAPAGPEGLTVRLAAEGDTPNGTVDHFAVLLGANTELRHRGNLSMAYQVLVEQGYRRESIYILDSEPETTFFPATDVTTRETVRRLFAHLRRIVEPHDTLLIYVTGHGRRVTAEQDANGARSKVGVSTLLLNATEELSEWEFSLMLEGVNPSVGIAFFDQCYGAIFASTAKSCNYVFITAAAEDETSYGVTFPRAFWGAFRALGKPGLPLSVREAYDVAHGADRGTALGYNQPDFKSGCVNASRLTLLGDLRQQATVLTSNRPLPVEPANPVEPPGAPDPTAINAPQAP